MDYNTENLTIDYKTSYIGYCNMCYFNGDIWAEYFTPYSFEEWMDAGCPDNPGENDEFCNKRNK